jgi:hypothetical protein
MALCKISINKSYLSHDLVWRYVIEAFVLDLKVLVLTSIHMPNPFEVQSYYMKHSTFELGTYTAIRHLCHYSLV